MDSPPPGVLGRLESGLRTFASEPVEWFLLAGDRLLLAALLTGVFAAGVLAVGATGVVDGSNSTGLIYLFQALVAGNLTLVTIVLSINQLVLSREFKPPGEVRDEIHDTIGYRDEVAGITGEDQVPTAPNEFLDILLRATRTPAGGLGSAVADTADGERAAEVDWLASDISEQTDRIRGTLETAGEGIFATLSAAIEADFARELNEVRRVRGVHGDVLNPEAAAELETLEDNLMQIDVARQYYRAIYLQVELADFSRILLYVGVPAIGSALLALLLYAGVSGTPVRVSHLDVLVPAVVVLGSSHSPSCAPSSSGSRRSPGGRSP